MEKNQAMFGDQHIHHKHKRYKTIGSARGSDFYGKGCGNENYERK